MTINVASCSACGKNHIEMGVQEFRTEGFRTQAFICPETGILVEVWDDIEPQLLTFFGRFGGDLHDQLEADQKRWGNTWIVRGERGQEGRLALWFFKKYLRHVFLREPFPWMKLAGEAFIGQAREKYI